MLCLFITSSITAQTRKLEIRDRGEFVYGDGDENEALVVFYANKNIIPRFYTSLDMAKSYDKPKVEDNDLVYRLRFETTKGLRETTQKLIIRIAGFEMKEMTLNLMPKRQYHYHIYDPDAAIVGCYMQLRREGDQLFGVCNYEGAKNRYIDIKNTCKDVSIDSIFYINKRIEDIDSILVWKNIMDKADKKHDYQTVFKMCYYILSLNIEDKNVRQRMYDVKFQIEQEKKHCQTDFEIADAYRKEKDYEKATETYQKIIDSHCEGSPLAVKKMYALAGYKYLPQVMTYEWQLNTFIGFSVGKYMSDRKVRGYFTLRFAPSLFEMIRKNVREGKKPEFDVSFGLTKKIYRPVWCFFGVGYTGVIKTDYSIDEKNNEVKQKYKLLHAASPEVGIMLKVPFSKKIGMAVRYTFQYRFAIKKEDINYIGRMHHVVGLGFCW